MVPPVGFWGELRMTKRVRSESRLENRSRSMENPRLSNSGNGTGLAPLAPITDSYMGNPGFGYIASSPGSSSASIEKNRIGLAPA